MISSLLRSCFKVACKQLSLFFYRFPIGRLDRFLLCLLFHCLQSLTLQSNSNSTIWHNSWWWQPLLCSGDLLQAWGQLWANEELIKLYCSSAICTARKTAAVKDGRVWVWLGDGEFTRAGTKYCCVIYHYKVWLCLNLCMCGYAHTQNLILWETLYLNPDSQVLSLMQSSSVQERKVVNLAFHQYVQWALGLQPQRCHISKTEVTAS